MRKGSGPFPIIARLSRDEHGSILVQFTVYMIAIMGMMGLALDGARFLLLNNSLQDLADASALAAAAQMDGSLNSLTNARNAASNLATNNTPTRWYDVSGATQTVQFYESVQSIDRNITTNDPKNAHFAKVTTGSWQIAPSFLSAIKTVANSTVSNNATSATAVAQNNFVNCAPTQSFICNPYEGSEANPGNANNFSSNVPVGAMIHLVNAASPAGNWGLIEPPAGQGPYNLTPFWAETQAGRCISGSQGYTRTGNVPKFAKDGMNVRFDSPIGSGDESLSAPIVIDGFKSNGNGFKCNRIDPNQGGTAQTVTPKTPSYFDPNNYSATCNLTTSTTFSCPLPRDRTITNTNNIGTGANPTDLEAYWKNHHSGSLPSGIITRFQIYQQEVPVSQGGLGTASFTAASDLVEPSGPTCTNSTVGNLSRRVLNVAVVDCSYWAITGHKSLPPTTLLAQFFMTEPALSNGSIFGEYIGCSSSSPSTSAGCAAGSGLPNPLYPIVQLIR
jgi:Flp pilus assembly protein TadG